MANPYPAKPGAGPSAISGPSSYPSSARVIELVDSRRQRSIQYNTPIFMRLQSWYSAYRGYWQGRIAQFRNNVTLPFTFAMIQSDVARKVQSLFGSYPYLGFEGYAPEDAPRAKKNEILISAQFDDADTIMKAIDFMLMADICGTGIYRYGWETRTRQTEAIRKEAVAPGLSVPVRRTYTAEIFDGPVWEPIDRLDFWQQPGIARIRDMRWTIHRYWKDLDDMLQDSQGDDPYFDPAAVRLLKDYPLQGFAHGEFIQRRVTFRNEYDYMARQRERFAKPVEIWEMHGEVPPEFTRNGVTHLCIAIGNGRVVLKNRPGLPNGEMPFGSYNPMPDPFSFDGVGKAEVAYGPQQTVNRLANQKLDALDQLIDPMFVASNSSGINTGNLFTRAGRIILVDGAADDSNIRPLIPNMQGVALAYQEIGQLWQFMQLGAGINDIIMGLQGGDRETARGFLGRQENVLTRLSMETTIAEQMWLVPLANAFRELDRRYLDLPHEMKILGSLASIDPITGEPYGPEMLTVDEDDLAPDYRARAVASNRMMSKATLQQNMIGWLQMVAQIPTLAQQINWAAIAPQLGEVFGIKNTQSLLLPRSQQVPLGPNGQPVEQQANGPQPLPQLNPNQIGAMMNTQPVSPLAAA